MVMGTVFVDDKGEAVNIARGANREEPKPYDGPKAVDPFQADFSAEDGRLAAQGRGEQQRETDQYGNYWDEARGVWVSPEGNILKPKDRGGDGIWKSPDGKLQHINGAWVDSAAQAQQAVQKVGSILGKATEESQQQVENQAQPNDFGVAELPQPPAERGMTPEELTKTTIAKGSVQDIQRRYQAGEITLEQAEVELAQAMATPQAAIRERQSFDPYLNQRGESQGMMLSNGEWVRTPETVEAESGLGAGEWLNRWAEASGLAWADRNVVRPVLEPTKRIASDIAGTAGAALDNMFPLADEGLSVVNTALDPFQNLSRNVVGANLIPNAPRNLEAAGRAAVDLTFPETLAELSLELIPGIGAVPGTTSLLRSLGREGVEEVIQRGAGAATRSADDLITLYHGTNAADLASDSLNPGSFLTTNPDLARSYGPNVIEVQVPRSQLVADDVLTHNGVLTKNYTLGASPQGQFAETAARQTDNLADLGSLKGRIVTTETPASLGGIKTIERFGDVPRPYGRNVGGGTFINDEEKKSIVSRLTQLIQEAKPANEATTALRSEELSRRAGRAAGAIESGKGAQRFQAAKGQLAGELPTSVFEPVQPNFHPQDIDSLFDMIAESKLRPFEQINTADALTKLLGGNIPTRSELIKLEKVFGPDLVKAILGKRSLGEKAFETVIDLLNLPRTFATSWDASAPLRQGVILSAAHPKEAGAAFWAMVRAMGSPRVDEAVESAIQNSKWYGLMEKSGLYLAPSGRSATLAGREEAFMSRLASRIPGVGASERGYRTYLNKLRADTFSTVVNNWDRAGILTDQRAKKLSAFLNVASGRGRLGKLEDVADILAIPFFAPRLLASRFQVPLSLFEKDAHVRQQVARDLLSFVGVGTAVLGIAHAAGADVELDPRSTDFGKIKVGNTRIDFWGGFQPVARYTAQIMTGRRKTSDDTFDDVDRRDTFERFIRSKLSPGGSIVYDLYAGNTFMGEELEATPGFAANEALKRTAPLFLQDMYDAVRIDGVKGGLLTAPAFFGASALTYEPSDAQTFRQQFEKAARQDWDKLLDHERYAILEKNPELQEAYEKWQDSRETVLADITRTKYEKLADPDLIALAKTDPAEYRRRAGEIVATAGIEYDFAERNNLIPQSDFESTPDQKAVDGYYEAISGAVDKGEVDYELREKLGNNYLATLSPEMRQKVINELSYSRDPVYRELLQDRQKLTTYFNAPDEAFAIARTQPESSALLSNYRNLSEFRADTTRILREAGVPDSEISSALGRIEKKLGLPDLISAARKAAIAQDPSAILILEKWGYKPSQELKDFAAEVTR